jgi:hypothetical protein
MPLCMSSASDTPQGLGPGVLPIARSEPLEEPLLHYEVHGTHCNLAGRGLLFPVPMLQSRSLFLAKALGKIGSRGGCR